jgi:hypothetical protein
MIDWKEVPDITDKRIIKMEKFKKEYGVKFTQQFFNITNFKPVKAISYDDFDSDKKDTIKVDGHLIQL